MSLILEALKRSEKDRQQQAQSVTDTFYITRETPRGGLWLKILIALLLLNVLVIAGYLINSQLNSEDTVQPGPTYPASTKAPASSREITQALKPVQNAPRVAERILRPIADEIIVSHHKPFPAPTQSVENPETLQKAPPALQPLKATGAEIPAPLSSVSYKEMDENTLNILRHFQVNTIVYSDNPERRFVLINMEKFKESATLPGSHFRIHEINADGMIIDTGDGFVVFKPEHSIK